MIACSALLLALLGAPPAQEAALPDDPLPAGSPAAPAAAEEALPLVELSEIRAHPVLWLGREVRFVFQFDAPREDRDAPFSGLDSATHWAFRAWGDEQPLWIEEEYEDPGTRLYVPLGAAAEMRLRVARRFERFEARGRVRRVLAGEAWIEVDSAQRLGEAVGEGSLIHATRGIRLAEEGRWYLAADQLERALAARLPELARAELVRLRDECLRRYELERAIKRRGVF